LDSPFFCLKSYLLLVIHTASRLCVDGYLENPVLSALPLDGPLDGDSQDVRLSHGLDAGVGGDLLDGIDVLGENPRGKMNAFEALCRTIVPCL